ncbi:SCO5918 family protein [Yinghuangia soli]|uniref:SCO5918 family protein n=1 Tax=Yinghuangia soli TaxID=2908204 RepID=A0AA41PWE0_9ACTN|nr:SCO5918 family protein [Yinghuangia soli]MCF2526580.1 SCO5918 family protein [Yinghuangia soli]
MRCVIAGVAFDLTKDGVVAAMKGVKAEPATGVYVIVGRGHYPVKQVGEVVTGQDRRDFTATEVARAMTRLGFTVRDAAAEAAARELTPLEAASAMLGTPMSA